MSIEQAGLALQGFGAGLTGQGQQFQRNQVLKQQMGVEQDEERRKQAALRQKTLFTDAEGALGLINNGGRFDLVAQLFGNRARDLESFPEADPSDTQRMQQLAMQASNGDQEAQKALTLELEKGVSVGRAYGLLEGPSRLKDSDVSEAGQTFETDAQGNVVARDVKGFKYKPTTGVDAPSNVREFQFWEGLSPEKQEQYMEVKRAAQIVDMGGGLRGKVERGQLTPLGEGGQSGDEFRIDFLDSESALAGGKSTATEMAKLKAQFTLAPKVEAAVKTAVLTATAHASLKAENRSNARTLEVYDIAMGGLVTALGATITGPGASWLPAMTSNQQIAKGGLAAMAPVLKQIFRAAGEGTFTKDDQEILMAMLPTLDDTPKSRLFKARSIDSIVRAKLGPGAADVGSPGGGGAGEGQTATGPNGEKIVLIGGQWVQQ
jgi:hypothetical protein